jgi:predicted SnoaL-like aldol condensation-catalyzing enzyme
MRRESAMIAMSRKEAAIDFLYRAASGDVGEAFRDYAHPDLRHHNPFFRGDAQALKTAMAEQAAQSPQKVLDVQRALEEGNLVVVHSRVRFKPEDAGVAVVHIFRFEGDRIAELWDIGQPVPESSPNEHGMF